MLFSNLYNAIVPRPVKNVRFTLEAIGMNRHGEARDIFISAEEYAPEGGKIKSERIRFGTQSLLSEINEDFAPEMIDERFFACLDLADRRLDRIVRRYGLSIDDLPDGTMIRPIELFVIAEMVRCLEAKEEDDFRCHETVLPQEPECRGEYAPYASWEMTKRHVAPAFPGLEIPVKISESTTV
ncbi:MAG: hypothetical protein IK105_06210 [Thermoguttaceae bacterium]|nr:hypothetical protein [Thermoguttaceae bacterium]